MYNVGSIILFVAEHRATLGDRAPHIISNAFKASGQGMRGMFSGGAVTEIMEGDVNLATAFSGLAQGDMRYMQLFFDHAQGKVSLDLGCLVMALFGGLPEGLLPFLTLEEDVKLDTAALSAKIGEMVRAMGVDWEDNWIGVTTETAPPPEEPKDQDDPSTAP